MYPRLQIPFLSFDQLVGDWPLNDLGLKQARELMRWQAERFQPRTDYLLGWLGVRAGARTWTDILALAGERSTPIFRQAHELSEYTLDQESFALAWDLGHLVGRALLEDYDQPIRWDVVRKPKSSMHFHRAVLKFGPSGAYDPGYYGRGGAMVVMSGDRGPEHWNYLYRFLVDPIADVLGEPSATAADTDTDNEVVDDASWHADGDFPDDLPAEAGATHIGMFLAWAVLTDRASSWHLGGAGDLVHKLKQHEITPGAYVLALGDGVLTTDDLSPEAATFGLAYYPERYLTEYAEHIAADLPSAYHVPDTWQTFERVAAMLEERVRS